MENNLLIDLTALLVGLRADIRAANGAAMVQTALTALESNQTSAAFANALLINAGVAMSSNRRGKPLPVKDIDHPPLRQLLLRSFRQLSQLLTSRQYEQAYDLTDTIHFLPELFGREQLLHRNDYTTCFVKPYTAKWHDDLFDKMVAAL